MKIMEMSFMIVAIFIFFMLVALFWITIYTSGVKQQSYEGQRQKAILLVSTLSETPEFSCAIPMTLCVDADKLVALASHTRYSGFWGVKGLQVKQVYPYSNQTIECTIGNYPKCNTYTIIKPPTTGIIEDSSSVAICRREIKNEYPYQECTLGRISVFTAKTA